MRACWLAGGALLLCLFGLLGLLAQALAQTPSVGLQRDHTLSHRLISWYKAVPGLVGGRHFYDLMGRNHATFVLGNGTAGWATRAAAPGYDLVLTMAGTPTSPDYPAATTSGMDVQVLTLSAWLYYAGTTCEWTTVMSKGESGTGANQDFSLGLNCDTAALRVEFNVSNTPGVFNSALMPTQQWFHLAATYDGAARRIYINGVLQETMATVLSITNTYNVLFIGWHWWANWVGALDDLRIYARALRPAEIALLAQKVPDQAQLRPVLPIEAFIASVSAGAGGPRGSFFPFFPAR